jgi:branched-chain amino acid transport system substrate-binding protein
MDRHINKKPSPPPIVFIALALIAFGAYKLVPTLLGKSSEKPVNSQKTGAIDSHLSLGNQILVTSETTAKKQAGVAAFAKGDYKGAIEHFQASLQQKRNDPETAIYLNNAKVNDTNPVKIAVSVPIGSNPNVAQEILRGVAQAQDEINANGGIRGQGLQVAIANDENSSDLAKQVAEALANDPQILAVIGHNASNANAVARWGGKVNWRTATSFDATKAAIAGLLQSTKRDGLQQALKNPNFSAPGASEDVRFLPTGDRAGNPILVQVKSVGNAGYDFAPIAN